MSFYIYCGHKNLVNVHYYTYQRPWKFRTKRVFPRYNSLLVGSIVFVVIIPMKFKNKTQHFHFSWIIYVRHILQVLLGKYRPQNILKRLRKSDAIFDILQELLKIDIFFLRDIKNCMNLNFSNAYLLNNQNYLLYDQKIIEKILYYKIVHYLYI